MIAGGQTFTAETNDLQCTYCVTTSLVNCISVKSLNITRGLLLQSPSPITCWVDKDISVVIYSSEAQEVHCVQSHCEHKLSLGFIGEDCCLCLLDGK